MRGFRGSENGRPDGRHRTGHAVPRKRGAPDLLHAEGIRSGEGGEIWLAAGLEIANLQRSVGRDIRSIAMVTVSAESLEYGRFSR